MLIQDIHKTPRVPDQIKETEEGPAAEFYKMTAPKNPKNIKMKRVDDVAMDPRKYEDINTREPIQYEPGSVNLYKIKKDYSTLVTNIDTAFDKKNKTGANYMKQMRRDSRSGLRGIISTSLNQKLSEYGMGD